MKSFREFLKENRRDRKTAIKVLNRIIPKHWKGESVPNLVKWHPHDIHKDFHHDGKPIKDPWKHVREHGSIREVDLKTVVSAQDTISHKVLRRKVQGQWKEHQPETPYMYHHEGTHYMVDGNTRGSEKKLKGHRTIMARVADVDYKPNE